MDYILLTNNEKTMISKKKVAVLLEYLSNKDIKLYLYATTIPAWRDRIVPIVQWVSKNREQNPDFKLKVSVMDYDLNKFQEEFLSYNNVECVPPTTSNGMYSVDCTGMICLNGKFIAQIYDNKINDSLPE